MKQHVITAISIAAGVASGLALLGVALTRSQHQQTIERIAVLETSVNELKASTDYRVAAMSTQLETEVSHLAADINALSQPVVPATATPAPAQEPGWEVTPSTTQTAAEPRYYLIRPGDTFTSIASHHDFSVDDLEEANPNVRSDHLDVGQRIKLPVEHRTE